MRGSLNPNTKKIVAVVAATFIIAVLLIALTYPVQAYEVQVSGLPSSVPLDKETTIVITIDLEGAQSVPINGVEIVLSQPIKGIIANGSFDANGTIVSDGGFIASVSLVNGTILQGYGFDSTTGIAYSVKILLKSSDFPRSTGNELTVFVNRGVELSRLRTLPMTFDIVGPNPWPTVILGVAVTESCIFLGLFYAFRKRRIVRKRRSRKK